MYFFNTQYTLRQEALQFLDKSERKDLQSLLSNPNMTAMEVRSLFRTRTTVRDILLEFISTRLESGIKSLLEFMIEKADQVYDWAATQPPRKLYDKDDDRPSYDPSKGVAYHMTQSGRPIAAQPVYTNTNARFGDGNNDCNKRGAYDKHGRRSRAAGILSIHCMRSEMVIGLHIMDEAEGRRDMHSALFRYHPGGLTDVVSDFSCGLYSYGMNRTPHFYRDIDHANDIFHGCKSHAHAHAHAHRTRARAYCTHTHCLTPNPSTPNPSTPTPSS